MLVDVEGAVVGGGFAAHFDTKIAVGDEALDVGGCGVDIVVVAEEAFDAVADDGAGVRGANDG